MIKKNDINYDEVFTKEWLLAALVRAIKTAVQTIVAIAGVGVVSPIYEINWIYILGVSATAFVLSLLTSVAGIPETTYAGTMYINNTDDKITYRMELNGYLGELTDTSRVQFKVEPEVTNIKEEENG